MRRKKLYGRTRASALDSGLRSTTQTRNYTDAEMGGIDVDVSVGGDTTATTELPTT